MNIPEPRQPNWVEMVVWAILIAVLSLIVWSVTGCKTITLPHWTADNGTVTPTLPTTTTTTVKPADGLSTEIAMGFSHPAAIDCTLTTKRLTASTWTYSLSPRNWRIDDDKQGQVYLGYRRGDVWVIGRFDHFRPNGTSRDFANVYGGESKFRFTADPPIAGEDVCLLMISYDNTKRSNAVFHKWKGQ